MFSDFEAEQARAEKKSPKVSNRRSKGPIREAARESKNLVTAIATSGNIDESTRTSKSRSSPRARSRPKTKTKTKTKIKSRRTAGNKATVKAMIEMGILRVGPEEIEMHYK